MLKPEIIKVFHKKKKKSASSVPWDGGPRGRNHMEVGFKTAYAISANHH